MSTFEFTSALFGFVVALGIARVLGGVADLIRFWRRAAAPGLYLTWFFLLLLIYLGWWVSIWRHADAVRVSLLELIVTFHVPAFIYLSTRLLVPTEGDFESIDERYDQVRTPFLCCLAAAGLFAPLLGLVVARDVGMAYLLTMSLMQLSLIFVRKRAADYFVSAASCVLYLAFLVQYRSVIAAA
jgi:hypothetical protein